MSNPALEHLCRVALGDETDTFVSRGDAIRTCISRLRHGTDVQVMEAKTKMIDSLERTLFALIQDLEAHLDSQKLRIVCKYVNHTTPKDGVCTRCGDKWEVKT